MTALKRIAAFIDKYVAVFAVLGLVGLFALGLQVRGVQESQHDSLTAQNRNRVANVLTWCNAINEGRDYNRRFSNMTAKQSASEVKILERAISGRSSLTHSQVAFLRLYFDSVIALEKAVPKTLTLHAYSLPDLKCRALASQTRASTRH